MISRSKSEALFAEALKYIPGGVNSPVRAFRAVGGQPFFVNKAKGAHIWDVDGNEYLDYVGTWGPAILGHAHPKIVKAVQQAAEQGTSFAIPNPFEVTMQKRAKPPSHPAKIKLRASLSSRSRAMPVCICQNPAIWNFSARSPRPTAPCSFSMKS